MKEHLPGDIVDGRYRIVRIAGRGGFAAVYEAVDVTTDRRVALKVLEPDAGVVYKPQTRARIERELRVLGSLTNPHSVRLYTFGQTADARIYLVFEYVDGRDLSEVLAASGPLPPPVIVHIVAQLLAALAEAHRAGLVHRDIKPENVRIFTAAGDPWRAKLLDFGIARPIEPGDARVTATGELLGTPRYMAPEQLLGEPLSPSSDLYALGIVALEMLAGRDALHGGRWSDQLDRLQSGYLFAVTSDESANLATVIRRMTARSPADRFASAEAALQALVGPTATSHLPVEPPTRTPGPPDSTRGLSPAPGASRRGSAGRWIALASAVTAAVAGVALWSGESSDRREAPSPDERRPTTPLSRALPAPAPSPVVDRGGVMAAAPDSGCGSDVGATGTRTQEDAMQGLETFRWLSYVPKTYAPDQPHPLLVLLHQDGETAQDLLSATGFEALAEQHRFVVVAPIDGGKRAWRDPRAGAEWVRDVVIAQTQREVCIDPTRIFVVGMSQGGMLAELLTCADWVAAVALHSHRGPSATSHCDTPRPFIVLSPRYDRHTPFDGGNQCGLDKISVRDFEAAWRLRNGCRGRARPVFDYAGSACYRWQCDAPLESCHLEGGHQWPGARPRPPLYANRLGIGEDCDGKPADFPSSERIWSFFAEIKGAAAPP